MKFGFYLNFLIFAKIFFAYIHVVWEPISAWALCINIFFVFCSEPTGGGGGVHRGTKDSYFEELGL